MSTEHVILVRDDERAWEALADDPAGQDERRTQYMQRHDEFVRRAAAEGHTVTASGELRKTAEARVVRPGATAHGATLVTDGPYAELAEQVGGYYVVTTDDVDGLVRVIEEAFAGSPEVFELRATVPEGEQSGAEPVAGAASVGAAS
jgi:hypothetical protein